MKTFRDVAAMTVMKGRTRLYVPVLFLLGDEEASMEIQ